MDSLPTALESEVSADVSELAASVKLLAIDQIAVDRVGISATSALDMLFRLIIPLIVSVTLLLASCNAISPMVSSADGAPLTKLLIATLIALFLLTISAFNAFTRELSAAISEVSMRVKLDDTLETALERLFASDETTVESEPSTVVKEVAAFDNTMRTEDTAVERVTDSVDSAVESEPSTTCNESAVLVTLDATVETAIERNNASEDTVLERELPRVVIESVALVSLDVMDDTAVERLTTSVEIVVESVLSTV